MKNEDYRTQIDRIIREMTGEIVLNGSPEHATIIVERMLANAIGDVSILTRRFDPRIYGTTETVKQASLFLGDRTRTVEVMIEEVDEETLADHPFVKCNREAIERGNLQFRRLNPEHAKGVQFNFALMDDTGYRFENDKRLPVASAAFGDNPLVPRLRRVFAELWNEAAPINPRIHA